MAVSRYLAMTAAEIQAQQPLAQPLAYMACHFSPYGTGLTGIPESLPKGSMLILNDRTPICRHDSALIARQLAQAAERLECGCVLLDLQRRDCPELTYLVAAILDALPCPAAVSDLYATGFSCPVFLSPVPLDVPPAEHIAPWRGRELWLDAALEASCITVTAEGSRQTAAAWCEPPEDAFTDEQLYCRYTIQSSSDQLLFHLYRTKAQLEALLADAERLGVTRTIGLYQEWIGSR